MVLGDDFVASTVVAERFTKRNVNVNGQGQICKISLMCLFLLGLNLT